MPSRHFPVPSLSLGAAVRPACPTVALPASAPRTSILRNRGFLAALQPTHNPQHHRPAVLTEPHPNREARPRLGLRPSSPSPQLIIGTLILICPISVPQSPQPGNSQRANSHLTASICRQVQYSRLHCFPLSSTPNFSALTLLIRLHLRFSFAFAFPIIAIAPRLRPRFLVTVTVTYVGPAS